MAMSEEPGDAVSVYIAFLLAHAARHGSDRHNHQVVSHFASGIQLVH